MGSVRNCALCGKEFIPNTINQLYCCSSCSSRANNIRTRERRKASIPVRVCKYCGKEFKSTSRWRYCSDECSKANTTLNILERNKSRDKSKHSYHHHFRTPPVLNRCQLCGGIMSGDKFVICQDCLPYSTFKIDNKLVYTGEVIDRIFPIGGEK